MNINFTFNHAKSIMNYFAFYFMQWVIDSQNTYLSLMQEGPLSYQLVLDVVKAPEVSGSLV